MNKKQILFFGILILIIMLSCDRILNSTNSTFNQASNDTIHSVKIKSSDRSCRILEDSYYKRFGIAISNYYIIKDSLAIDLNNDSFIDTVVILSPIPLELIVEDYNCIFEKQPKRLLVEIINNNGKSKIRSIYTNLISNVGGVLSHYSGIFKTIDGFKVIHQAGAKYSWTYSTEFSIANKDMLTLFKISKTCSYEGEERKLDYHFKNTSIGKIDIPDTLQLNCNCEKYWMELETK